MGMVVAVVLVQIHSLPAPPSVGAPWTAIWLALPPAVSAVGARIAARLSPASSSDPGVSAPSPLAASSTRRSCTVPPGPVARAD